MEYLPALGKSRVLDQLTATYRRKDKTLHKDLSTKTLSKTRPHFLPFQPKAKFATLTLKAPESLSSPLKANRLMSQQNKRPPRQPQEGPSLKLSDPHDLTSSSLCRLSLLVSCKSNDLISKIQNQKQRETPRPKKNPFTPSAAESKQDSIYLNEDEKKKFAYKHFMKGLTKVDLLGKGGFALVYLAQDQSGHRSAVKQLRSNGEPSSQAEMQFYQKLKDSTQPSSCFVPLLRAEPTGPHLWLQFELGGPTLAKSLFTMKGQFLKGERVYRILYSDLHRRLVLDDSLALMRDLVGRLALALRDLKALSTIHADLKLENILLPVHGSCLSQIKLIDFGSSILLDNPSYDGLQITTPEYMPPELLEYQVQPYARKKSSGLVETLQQIYGSTENSHKIDVWSAGVILLEILSGIPMWISYKCLINRKGKDILGFGLFSSINRGFDKILTKQKQFGQQAPHKLMAWLPGQHPRQVQLRDLLVGMLKVSPQERMSPEQILAHPFLS